MTHTPRLLRVREQSEWDKALKSVMLEDDAGEFVIAASEGDGDRIAALWNMAERLGLTTEEIESGNVETKLKTAPDMLETLEGAKWLIECYVAKPERYEEYQDVVEAIRKARGEE